MLDTHGSTETGECQVSGIYKDSKRPNIICITTCRSRVSHNSVNNVTLNQYAHLFLDRVECDIISSVEIDGISGYVIEICSLKYNNTQLTKSQFVTKIQQFNSMINSNIPVLWITHANVTISPAHVLRIENHDEIINADNRLINRVNIDNWLTEAVKNCPRSTVLKPSELLSEYNSEHVFQKRDHTRLGVDLAHYNHSASNICFNEIKKYIKMLFADEKS